MTTITPNLGLTAFSTPEDSEELVYDYINYVSGSATGENLKIIDDFAGVTNASLVSLSNTAANLVLNTIHATSGEIEYPDSNTQNYIIDAGNFKATCYAKRGCVIQLCGSSASLTTADTYTTLIPDSFGRAYKLSSVSAQCGSASVSGNVTLNVDKGTRNYTSGSYTWTDLLAVPITILSGEYIDDGTAQIWGSRTLFGGDWIRIRVTTSGTYVYGAYVSLSFEPY